MDGMESGNSGGSLQWRLCSQLLPKVKGHEQVKEEDKAGNEWQFDAERKDACRNRRLQVDIDCHDHLSPEEESCDEQDSIFAFWGQRSPKPRQQEEDACEHLRQLAGKNGFMGQMTLLNLDFKPSMERLEEFEESEEEHEDTQEQR